MLTAGTRIGVYEIADSLGAGGELKKVPITGGPPVSICRYQGRPRGAASGRDDTIVFATNDVNTGLLSVPAAGGDPKVLTKADTRQGQLDHVFPALLPDGRHVLFTVMLGASPDASQIAVLDLQTNQVRTLVRRQGWSKDGKELFYLASSTSAMMAVPIQTSQTSVAFSAGNPVKLFDGPWYVGQSGRTYDVSRDGKRFVMIRIPTAPNEKSAQPTITVVLNWTEELRAPLPAK